MNKILISLRKTPQIVLTIALLILLLSNLFGLPDKVLAVSETTNHATELKSEEEIAVFPEEISDNQIHPGLQVTYYTGFFKRDVNYLKKMHEGEFESFKGAPILELNHQFHKDEVFESGTNRGVALKLNGFIHLPEAGTYQFQALSNDGINLYLSGKLVLSDPKQHSDRLSEIGTVVTDSGGWVPLYLEYFQRKGTAALKLFWKNAGQQEFVPVPAKAYGSIE